MQSSSRLYQCPIPIIGLTGGIASGKSTVSSILSSHQYHVICADQLVHRIYEDPKTQDFLQEINTDFIQNGKVHFSTLRQAFFNEKTLKEKIEQFIYQALPQQFKHEQNQKISQGAKCIVYDVPLLFEKKLESLLDTNCLVYCSKKLQLERLIKRDQLSDDLANQMLAAQLPIDEKKEKADYIIDNSLPIDAHLNPLKDNTLKIFEKITKELKP